MVVNLKSFKDQMTAFYEYLLGKFHRGELVFVDRLMLSSIGARTCYSSASSWEELLGDKRIAEEDERFAFLERLYEAKHDSIFAHSPILFTEDGTFVKFNVFKLWQFYNKEENKTYFCANARHLVEAMRYKSIGFDVLVDYLKSQKEPFLVLRECEDVNGTIAVIPETKPWFWTSVIVFGVSRVMTHQYVRHTWLNFSQRSHRYTKAESVICPPSIEKNAEAKSLFLKARDEVKDVYENLMGTYGIKKEDARFIMPEGTATSIMASAPLFVWEDFVEKRCHPKAQWEIRRFAQEVKKVLDEVRT